MLERIDKDVAQDGHTGVSAVVAKLRPRFLGRCHSSAATVASAPRPLRPPSAAQAGTQADATRASSSAASAAAQAQPSTRPQASQACALLPRRRVVGGTEQTVRIAFADFDRFATRFVRNEGPNQAAAGGSRTAQAAVMRLRPSRARIPSGALHIHHSEAFMEDAFLVATQSCFGCPAHAACGQKSPARTPHLCTA